MNANSEKSNKSKLFVFTAYFTLGAAAVALGLLSATMLDGTSLQAFRLWACIAAILLLGFFWIADQYSLDPLKKSLLFILAVLTVTAATYDEQTYNGLKIKRLHTWNMFHYVLATKYFNELGYFDLYNTAILGDKRGKNILQPLKKTRDMHTYEFISLHQALENAKKDQVYERFEFKRWIKFKMDLLSILQLRPPKRWEGPLADRGFNPSPAWLIIHTPLLNAVDIQSKKTLRTLASMQNILYLAGFIAFWWAFGIRKTLFATLWFCVYFGNKNRITGGYFPYDWFVFFVIAGAFYFRKKFTYSGFALAYTAMMRGFTGLTAIHPAIQWFKSVIRGRPPQRHYTIYGVALVCACLLLIVLGSAVTERGLSAWTQWAEKISIHSENHSISYNRIGLKYLFGRDFRSGDWDMPIKVREQLVKKNEPMYKIAKPIFIAFVLLAMVRRNDWEGYILGIAVVFFAMLLSRYYFSIAVLFFTWPAFDKRQIANTISSMWLFALVAFYWAHRMIPRQSWYETYYWFNLGIMVYLCVIIGYFLYTDYKWIRSGKNVVPETTSETAAVPTADQESL